MCSNATSEVWANSALATFALAAERADSSSVDWLELWSSLRRRETQVVETFTTQDRYYVVLERRDLEPVSGRFCVVQARPRLLEQWLGGSSPKVLSIDLGMSVSSVSSELKRELAMLGVACLPSQVPAAIGLLAGAGLGRSPRDAGRSTRFVFQGRDYVVASVARPEALLVDRLSPAEYITLCLLAEGASYASIARRRHVTRRTVANQVASLFRRLGVSGRLDLQRLLIEISAGGGTFAPEPTAKRMPRETTKTVETVATEMH